MGWRHPSIYTHTRTYPFIYLPIHTSAHPFICPSFLPFFFLRFILRSLEAVKCEVCRCSEAQAPTVLQTERAETNSGQDKGRRVGRFINMHICTKAIRNMKAREEPDGWSLSTFLCRGEGGGKGWRSPSGRERAGPMIWREMDWSEGYTEAWHEVLQALGKVVTGGRLCRNKGLLTTWV